MILTRIREFYREPAAVFWVYVFPLLMMAALGIAFRNRPVEQLNVLIQEPADGQPGGSLTEKTKRMQATLNGDHRFRARTATPEQCRQELRNGDADLVIVLSASKPELTYLYDPSRPGSHVARNAADDLLQRAAGRQDSLRTTDQEVSETGGRYIDFLVPGMVGMGIMGGGLWGVGFAIVDLRIRKLLKRFLATPMRRSQFLAAIMISRLLFTIPEILVLLVFARFIFGVENRGNYLAVGLIVIVGSFQFAGIGLLVACRAKTLETISGLMNLVMLPMWMASGIFFS